MKAINRGLSQVLTSAVVFLLCAMCGAVQAESLGPIEVVSVQKIWDQGNHNAFTDLIRHQETWFCVFREADKHVSPEGALRVLKSSDGENWSSAALIVMPETDLRDAKISATPDGKLMLCGAGARLQNGQKTHQTYVWFSDDGKTWTEPHPIGELNYWLWRVVWHNGVAYGFGYKTGNADRDRDGHIRFYKSTDGKTFEVVSSDLGVRSHPNETSLTFLEDGTAVCVLRRDGKSGPTALMGTSQAPYSDWKWDDLGVRVGGPAAISLHEGRFLVAGRKYPGGAKTQLWWLDKSKAALTEAVQLTSGGDTSYPGLVFHDGQLWVSYYSSHEGKSCIYLARLRLP